MKLRNLTLGALMLAACTGIAQDQAVVLKGLDHVQLLAGKEVAGKPEFASRYGRYESRFADGESKAKFDAAPANYAVQKNGRSILNARSLGSPDVYMVHDGKIYLARVAADLDRAMAGLERVVKNFHSTKTVAILVFPGVQIIDYSGPYEVFGQAGYEVFTVSEKHDPLQTSMVQTITPDYTFKECPTPDILLTPGGNVPQTAPAGNKVVEFVKSMSAKAKYTMSVCNGAFWLANAGLLDGKEATTFYGMVDDLKTKYPKVKVTPEARFTDNGNIMTTSGLSSGIDGALKLVGKIEGQAQAKDIALNMEYDYRPDSDWSRAAMADKYLQKVILPWDVLDDTTVRSLEATGDKSKWLQVYELVNPKLTKDMLETSLAKAATGIWTKGEEKDGYLHWKYKSEDGASWTVKTKIEPDAKETGRFVARLSIAKG